MRRRARLAPLAIGLLTLAAVASYSIEAQVLPGRLLRADAEPQNWLTYSGTYASHRYSQLTQIDPSNVGTLEVKWIWQAQSIHSFSATPLVVDGIMYVTQAPNDVVALDACWRLHPLDAEGCRGCRGTSAEAGGEGLR